MSGLEIKTIVGVNVKNLGNYSALALPLGFAGIPLYLYAPDFYAVELGLPLSMLSVVLLALRFVDAIQDPFLGIWSDRFANHRSLIICVSALLMALAFFLLFIPPISLNSDEGWRQFGIIAWFAAFTFIATTAFSILTINLNALGALWSNKEDDKARIVTSREIVGLVGLMIALVVPALLQEYMSRQMSFIYFGTLMFATVFIALLLFRRWFIKFPKSRGVIDEISPLEPSFGSYWRLLISREGGVYRVYALSVLASSLPAVLVLMFVRDYLKLEASFPLFMLIYVVSGIAFMPFWKFVGSRLGISKAWMISMFIAIIAFVWVTLISAGDMISFSIICLATGAVFGADIVLPQTLVAIDVHKKDTNTHGLEAGGMFALLAFLSKSALAIATGGALFLLDLGQFVPNTQNTEDGLFILLLLYAVIPCALKLLAAFLLMRINVEDTRQQVSKA